MPKTKTKKIHDHASNLAERIGPTVDTAREKAAPLIEGAREKAGPLVAEAREKAAPMVAEAREKAAPVIASGKDRLTTEVLPALTAALAAAEAATEDVREETMKRGKATVAALKGDIEPPKESHKLRTLLILLGLGGIAAFVAKRLSSRQPTTAWQSSYTPTPAATGSAAGGGAHRADEADDQGGATPDVAAADAAAEPHSPTTPENPAETIDVSKS